MNAFEIGFPAVSTLGHGDLCNNHCVPTLYAGASDEDLRARAEVAHGLFKEHGFVIVKGALGADEAAEVHEVCNFLQQAVQERDEEGKGNRNPGRYSLGATVAAGQCLHLGAFTRNLVDNSAVLDVLDRIFDQENAEGVDENAQYVISGAGGDYCLGNTPHFQKIHSDKSLARPLAPHLGDSSKGPIHSKEVPPLISVNYVVQELTRWNGAMRIVTWKDMEAFGRERLPPTLEQEYKEVPQWLSSKIFPLQAGDALIRDIRLWHGGCPNLSGKTRFLPSIEVMSREFFDWQLQENTKGKGCKGRGKANNMSRHGKPLMPEDLFNLLSERAQLHCREVVARGENDAVNSHIDDYYWLRKDLVKPARDPYHLDAVKSLEEKLNQDLILLYRTLEGYPQAGDFPGSRHEFYKFVTGLPLTSPLAKEQVAVERAVNELLNRLASNAEDTAKEHRAAQNLLNLLRQRMFPNTSGNKSALSSCSAHAQNNSPRSPVRSGAAPGMKGSARTSSWQREERGVVGALRSCRSRQETGKLRSEFGARGWDSARGLGSRAKAHAARNPAVKAYVGRGSSAASGNTVRSEAACDKEDKAARTHAGVKPGGSSVTWGQLSKQPGLPAPSVKRPNGSAAPARLGVIVGAIGRGPNTRNEAPDPERLRSSQPSGKALPKACASVPKTAEIAEPTPDWKKFKSENLQQAPRTV